MPVSAWRLTDAKLELCWCTRVTWGIPYRRQQQHAWQTTRGASNQHARKLMPVRLSFFFLPQTRFNVAVIC